jgi:ankyrin repeat protein
MENLNLSSLASLTSENLILKQLFTLWDQSFSCKEGYASFCKSILSGTTKALGIFLIQYLVKNPDKILSFFRSLILKFIYRRLELKPAPGTKDAYINKLLQKEINPKAEPSSSLTLSGFPLYLTANGTYTILEYCPGIHQKFVNDINTEADAETEVKCNKEIKTQCRDLIRKLFVPDTLFPSKNYLALDTIISNFFTVVNRTKMYKAQGILIDGEPGLGKSKSCDFLASLNKYHEVYYVNLSLTALLKKDFKSIIDEVLTKRNGSTIIYFDELDKYLDFYLEYSFHKQEEIQDFTEYKRRQKQEFLYQLLEVIETNIYEDGVVFIFCSNNFHTIFEDVNQVHFHSLKSRFAPIRFDRCDREELIKFIKFFNAKMLGTSMYYEEIDSLISNIKDHISLTYRSVRHCHVNAGYNLEKFIEFINEYEPEMSPRIEDMKIVRKISMKKLIEDEKKEIKEEELKKEEIKKEEIKKEEIKKEELSDIWSVSKEGDVDKVREKLATGIDPNIVEPVNGDTALMLASFAGKIECVRELIKSGADVNIVGPVNGDTALMLASSAGKIECVRELIRSGADVNIQNKHGTTALIYASGAKNIECIKVLINSGANVTLQNINSYTALMSASHTGKIECIEELVNSGADVNFQSKYGMTALMIASQSGQLESITELIKLGADINIQNKYGSTALMSAAQFGKIEAIKELIRSGADINIQNESGYTALMWASRYGHIESLKELIRSGADINIRNKDGATILMLAARNGSIECLNELIRLGIDINLQDNKGYIALMEACYSQNLKCVEEILKLGVDINYKANDGTTPLMHAIGYNRSGWARNPEIARLLLDAGADPILPSETGDLGKTVCDLVTSYQKK